MPSLRIIRLEHSLIEIGVCCLLDVYLFHTRWNEECLIKSNLICFRLQPLSGRELIKALVTFVHGQIEIAHILFLFNFVNFTLSVIVV